MNWGQRWKKVWRESQEKIFVKGLNCFHSEDENNLFCSTEAI